MTAENNSLSFLYYRMSAPQNLYTLLRDVL